jgi:transcriptional regulator with XRE-family HTH domain
MHRRLFKLKLNYLIGEFLWKERNAMGLSYESVTLATGVSNKAIMNYEKGLKGVPLKTLLRLSKLYRIEDKEFQFFLTYCQERAKLAWTNADYLRIEIHQFKVGYEPKS